MTSSSPATKLSFRAKDRLPSAIRSLYPAEKIPGMISLLPGKPNASTFPLKQITLDVETPDAKGAGKTSSTVSVSGADLETALQYGPTAGIPRLVEWIENLQSRMHNVERNDAAWRCSLGVGSQDCLTKAMEALLDPGDSLLVEAPTYPGILPQLRALGARVVELTPDAQGTTPEELERVLANWQTSERTKSSPFPKLLYLTPTGGNPTGASSSEERKRSILEVLRRYDVLLFEDDAYYFLDYSDLSDDPVTRARPKSYYSMDPEAKTVVRFDSFSKILSSGLRLGFVTGHKDLVDAIDQDSAGKNLHPSGVSQGVVLAILEHWGIDGFLRHVDQVAGFYKDRRDFFEAAAQKHLSGKADWVRPTAGMFLWIRLDLPDGDSHRLISQKAKDAGVLALPGVAFLANPAKSTYVRTSFSQVPLEQVDEAFRRLREVVDAAWAESAQAQ